MPITETRKLVVHVPRRAQSEVVFVVIMTEEEIGMLPDAWEQQKIPTDTVVFRMGSDARYAPCTLSGLIRCEDGAMVLRARGDDIEDRVRTYLAVLAHLLRETATLREQTLPAVEISVEA